MSISVSSALRSCPCMRTRLLEWSWVPHWIYIAAQQLLGALGLPRLNRCRPRDLWQRQWGRYPAKPNESCNAAMSSGRARSRGDRAGQVALFLPVSIEACPCLVQHQHLPKAALRLLVASIDRSRAVILLSLGRRAWGEPVNPWASEGPGGGRWKEQGR